MQSRFFLAFFALIFLASGANAIQIGPAAPKITTFRPCDTEVVVYDSRPELGIGMHDMSRHARDMAHELGVRLVRHTLYWNLMETTDKPGLYDSKYLAEWDKIVDDCRREGVCLEVVVHGDPPGVSYADRKAGYERFARFVADMAARYPSVVYWELFNEMDSGFTCLFGAKDNIPMRERGKEYADMLKVAYPVIKAANPSAWVICGGMSDTNDFPRGIYEGGGRRYFDIMSIHTYGVPVSKAFVDRGQAIRKIMVENGDESKPLWNTEFGLDAGNVVGAWGYPHDWKPAQEDGPTFDQKQLDDYQMCFQINNQFHIYDKVIPYQFQAGNERDDDGSIKTKAKLPAGMTIDDYGFGIVRRDMTPRPTYKWLNDSQVNSAILAKPRNAVNVYVATKVPMAPVGYDYKVVDGGIEIQHVVVDSLVPTSIKLIFIQDPESSKPDGKPSVPSRKNSGEKPDPWDI